MKIFRIPLFCHCERSCLSGRARQSHFANSRLLRRFTPRKDALLSPSLLINTKGISVLFLVIAMMLMVTIGYVFSYLIPTKQKSVRFPIYSTQTFYIAQSGVEFAVRYASSDQGWRGATDSGVFDLNRLNGISRPLGNGSFTINYNNAMGDILTSTGQITGLSENRVIRVSNFTPFLRLIFDPASSAPCWVNPRTEARFYIKNIGSSSITLTAFSASWREPPDRQLTSITMTLGMTTNAVFTGAYDSGINNFTPAGNSQTINPNQVIMVKVVWNQNINPNCSAIISFYDSSGKQYTFSLDPEGNGLPSC